MLAPSAPAIAFRALSLFLGVSLALGCSSREEPAGGGDAGVGADAGADAGGPGTDAGRDAGIAVDAGPLTGETRLFVVSFMDVGAPDPAGDPGVVPGFDLDGRVSDATDLSSCRRRDYTSPPPESEPGVDNQLGPLLADAEPMYHIRQNLEANVQSGAILVLLRVRGIDDLVDDDRVEVDALVGMLPDGVTAPTLDGAGRIVPDQTFDLDATSLLPDEETAKVTLRGRIVGGRLRAGPGDFTMSLPIEAERVAFEAKNAHIVFDITDTALGTGVMGGGLEVEGTLAAMEGVEGFNVAAARLLLESNADLDRDATRGRCLAISIALTFEGVSAMGGAVRDPAVP